MTNRKLFDTMRGIDPRLITDATPKENHQKPYSRLWVKWGSVAACFVLVAVLGIGIFHSGLFTVQMPSILSQNSGYIPQSSIDDTEKRVPAININEISNSNITNTTNFICLKYEDYTSLTYTELLKYFDISLPITESFPNFSLSNKDFGIYQSDKRNVYYDGNQVSFISDNKMIRVGLSKVMKHTGDIFRLTTDELKFTTINNRELAVYHYTDENGNRCYHTEFLQDGVAFTVGTKNLSVEEFTKLLQIIIEDVQQFGTGQTNSISGEVNAVDPFANRIVLKLNDTCAFGIELPDGESAENFSLGNVVRVTFTGEPATISTIWEQQIVNIEMIKHQS